MTPRCTGFLIPALVASILSLLIWAIESDPSFAASSPDAEEAVAVPASGPIIGLRRLTEDQYRNSIADVFGPGIKIVGRFEPILRPAHRLLATGASSATISPSGFEQFDQMARIIAATVLDEAHRSTYMPCTAVDKDKADPECASRFLKSTGRYIFRRPLTAKELMSFTSMADIGAEHARSFYSGLELALAAMLVSPNFLFIVESAAQDPAHPDQLRLDAYSTASRLSYLLWNTTPNDELLAAAERGSLEDPMVLSRIAEQMTASPRFEAGVRAFFSDMLVFEKFESMSKDPVIYRKFNQKIARDMPEQILRTIVDHVVNRRVDYRELFTTRRTFMTRALGPLYDLPVTDVSGGWEPYELPKESGRQGILSLAGFLAVNSHPGRSSPTLRGIAIREALLCQPVPPPPGNVNFTVVQDTTNPTLRTALARLTAHRTDPVCAACHQIMDPVGLPLEHFDGSGAYRDTENGAPLDVLGRFEKMDFEGVSGLGQALAVSQSTTQCVVSRAFEYARGKPADSKDDPALESLTSAFAAAGYTITSLFRLVATSPDLYRLGALSPASVNTASNHYGLAKVNASPPGDAR